MHVINGLFILIFFEGEPDTPVFYPSEEKLDGNSYTVPFKLLNNGGSPILHYEVQYRVVSVKLYQIKIYGVIK